MSSSEKLISFRGMKVIESWPAELEKAQRIESWEIDGVEYPRTRYGDEWEDWGADRQPCRDCGAVKGEFHVPGCEVERCPACDGQFISCDCDCGDESEWVTIH